MLDRVFERLLVTYPADPSSDGKRRWLCQCACGRTKVVREKTLLNGRTRSCGCLNSELSAERAASRVKHGHAGGKTPTYASWQSMRTRCLNPNDEHWPDYGARGITVCQRWDDFVAFLADMGERPARKTLDRIDVNGNYEPSNCRWATSLEQARNKRPAKAR